MASSIDPFLTKFSTEQGFSIPLPCLWSVSFLDTGFISDIQQSVQKSGARWSYGVKSANKWSGSGGEVLVAQEVSIPSESYEVMPIGQENRGGFMPGYGVTNRTDFLSRNVSINFLETGDDIETSLFRPWIIAIGTSGLLGGKFRTTIAVTEYHKSGGARKKYTFYNAFPTNVEGYTLTYSDSEFIIKSVSFGYTKYDVS